MLYQFYVYEDGSSEAAGSSNVILTREWCRTVELDITEEQLAQVYAGYSVTFEGETPKFVAPATPAEEIPVTV